MNVAIDARRLQDQPLTGVGRWIANLLPYLQEQFDIVLLTDQRRTSPTMKGLEVVGLPVPGALPEPYWLQVSAARWLRSFKGVFHGTYNAVPVAYRGHSIVSMYDLSWEHHPEDLSAARRAAFRTQARLSARRSDAVVTVSEHARQSIISTYRLPPQRVLLAPPSVDPIFTPDRLVDLPPILERLHIAGPYIVALGGAKRRGLEVAVEAWRRLPSSGERPNLVVVGSESPPHEQGIVYAGALSDADWSAVLAGAIAFCYPTRFEGYGMPALEAAASGTPVVCATIGPLPEVLGDAAQWCPTPSVDDIATGLAFLVGNEDRRLQLRKAGVAVAASAPTWEASAAVVAGAYRMAGL